MSAPMATEAVEAQRERLTTLDRAKSEEREALDAFRALDARQARFARHGIWTTETGEESIPEDAVERELLAAELAREREGVLQRLVAARRRREVAAVAHANATLPALVESHARAASQVEAKKAAFARATAAFVEAAWDYGEALGAESLAARGIVVAASEASATENIREGIRSVAHHRLPVELSLEGPSEWVERPLAELFERDARSDPRQLAYFDDVTSIARGGRDRLRLISGGLGEILKRRRGR